MEYCTEIIYRSKQKSNRKDKAPTCEKLPLREV